MGTGRHSVLIVDDERMNIIKLTGILGKDYAIYAAKNGADALEIAETRAPDVILLDVIMPDIDGYQVLTLLKGKAATKDIPVIFVTAVDDPESEEMGLSLGASDYITKPFRPMSVLFRVRNQIAAVRQARLSMERESQERGARARERFITQVSYELRNPLNAIIGTIAIGLGSDDVERKN